MASHTYKIILVHDDVFNVDRFNRNITQHEKLLKYSISTLSRGGVCGMETLSHRHSKKSTVEPRHQFLLILVSKFFKNIDKVLITFRKIYKTSVAGFSKCRQKVRNKESTGCSAPKYDVSKHFS